jgi:hypothetical protein
VIQRWPTFQKTKTRRFYRNLELRCSYLFCFLNIKKFNLIIDFYQWKSD